MSFGLILAILALSIGMIFFLYSMKYYITLILVLGISRRLAEAGKESKGPLKSGLRHSQGDDLSRGRRGLLYSLFRGSRSESRLPEPEPEISQPGMSRAEGLDDLYFTREPFVSIHLPFYNEKKVVNRILAACTSMEYQNYEVVVVDDSTDETVQILEKWADHPKVKIHHRLDRSGFKGGALKEALKIMDARTEFIIIFDADFVPYPDTISQFLKYFHLGQQAGSSRGNIAAVQGYQWHVLNKNENWITRGVRAEFAGSYVVERPGTEIVGSMKLIAGSVYMIRADVLKKYGWGTSITEDFQLTLRLYQDGYRVLYTPYIQAPSECVATLRRLIRQRMRWAEGHTHNVRKMFWGIMKSPHLLKREKLEFLYLCPYYLQAAFFIVGTLGWFISDAILHTKLPFWTEIWGWSLVFTNMFALPLMNAVGIFLEEGEQRDFLGIFSFVLLSYILVPFQAYAAIKGLFEKEEGHWFRTPKTGNITDAFSRSTFRRWFAALFPGVAQIHEEKPLPSRRLPVGASYLALATAHNTFGGLGIRPRNIFWLPKAIIIILITIGLNIGLFARNVPLALADTFTVVYQRTGAPAGSPAAPAYYNYQSNTISGGAGVLFTTRNATAYPSSSNWYWGTNILPTGADDASIAAGTYTWNWWPSTAGSPTKNYMNLSLQVMTTDPDGTNPSQLVGTICNRCWNQGSTAENTMNTQTIGTTGGATTITAAAPKRLVFRMWVSGYNRATARFNLHVNNATYNTHLVVPTLTVPEFPVKPIVFLMIIFIIPGLPRIIRSRGREGWRWRDIIEEWQKILRKLLGQNQKNLDLPV